MKQRKLGDGGITVSAIGIRTSAKVYMSDETEGIA
jgi:hypothetical protein